ncbi:uncharacterized protein LOC127007024 [Eriocheir sinensis]|uniref:uncharacterized protein LOC127007024 n=1 Tax=Eriocheir sinensis TaxID=95602 RepID=UPI0021C79A11|nr:uncharacterized protein LOC127007024 [Eriocheir sinensis]
MGCRSLVIVMTSFLWVTTTAATKESAVVRSVWVVRGGRAELPCAPTPKYRQDSASVVLWYRYSDTIPVYSYDAREGEFTSGVGWADEGELGGRAHFIPSSEPPTLVLEPAHVRDQGVYTCRVDYQLSPSTTAVVNLTVVVPPGPPMILWGGRGVVDVVGPLGEGERAELTCRSKGGRPPPMLSWTRRGQRLPLLGTNTSSSPDAENAGVEARVAIVGSRDLLGSTLSCHAHMPSLAQTLTTAPQVQTASVIVNVTLPPVTVRILSPGAAASAGTELRLTCRAAGSHPPAHLTWWNGHQRLSPVSYAVEAGGNVTSATLTLLVRREHNGETLTCTASNPALPGERHLSDSIKLSVYYAPVVRLSMGRSVNPSSLKEGDDVYFECSITANPPYKRVIWYHNGAVVAHNQTSGVIVSGQSLVLQHLRREHAGTYTCGATNHEGHNTSNAVILPIKHAPVCAGTGRERTQGAARGSTASIKCLVEAEPAEDVTWSWVRKRVDGTVEELPGEDVRVDGLSSSIIVTPISPEDYGRFLCRAANSVGRQREACVVTLVPAGPPDTPTNCSVSPADPSTVHARPATAALTVTCLEGFDGGLPQHFTLETWQDNELVANMTSMFPEWVVAGLRPGVGVTLRVAAHNTRGRSDALRFEVHTASAQHHAAPDSKWGLLGVPPLLGALVGVGAVLLLILITGVVVARHMRRPPPPTHVHTIIMTPTATTTIPVPDPDTYDPDVVSSLRRPADNLDVLPRSDHTHQNAPPAILPSAQAAMGQREQGQAVASKQGNRHASFSRGFCLHRQNSQLGDSEETADSDSDSTLTDLTAAGRAAAALPPASSHSLPRVKRRIQQLSSSPLDLQLQACQVSQVVTTPDGMIQRVPYLLRNPRQPPPSSSADLRHLTASAEELHPLIFSRDFRQLLTSADVRQLSYSGTELRLLPGTGTWPLGSSSGELTLPLQSSGTLRSITTEELRLMPSSSGSSPWDLQATPIFSRLSPVSHRMPCTEGTQLPPQTPITQPQPHSPCGHLHSRSSSTQPLLQAICTEPQPQPQPQSHCQDPRLYQPCVGHQSQEPSGILHHHGSCPVSQAAEVSAEAQSRLGFVDSHRQTEGSIVAPRPPCLEQGAPAFKGYKTTPTQAIVSEELQVSLRELQPPPAPSGEVEPLLDTIELQPPPSFREPEQFSQLEVGSLTDTVRQKKPVGQPVACPLPPSVSHLTQYKSPDGSGADVNSTIFQIKPSPCPALDELLQQPQDTFLPQSFKHEPTTSSINQQQSPERQEWAPEGGSRGSFKRKDSKKSVKQVTFFEEFSEGHTSTPAVARVPSKTDVGRSGKRCAQMFSRVDLPPPGHPSQPFAPVIPFMQPHRPPVTSQCQEIRGITYPEVPGTTSDKLHKTISKHTETNIPTRTCREPSQFSTTPSFHELQPTHSCPGRPTALDGGASTVARVPAVSTPSAHDSSQQLARDVPGTVTSPAQDNRHR